MATNFVLANRYKVLTFDLGIPRDRVALNLKGHALTVLRCTGTVVIRLNNPEYDAIRIDPLIWPATLTIDLLDFEEVYLTNTAQPGLVITILVLWKEEENRK